MWKIKHIFDGEYGCEELAEGQRPKVSVTLINEKEEETCFSVEDSWLTEHGLNEGDLWPKKKMSSYKNSEKQKQVIRTVSPTFVLRFIRRCQYAYSAC